jgi:arylsulfatase A-like enzyme
MLSRQNIFGGALTMKRLIVFFMTIVLFCAAGIVLFVNKLHAGDKGTGCNLVLITIDTLRTDHLSCYGYERNTTPHIDAIAEQGIIFRNVVAPSSWTAPSMASLFTSTYPINHGMVHGINQRKRMKEVLSQDLTTLPEILQKKGYTTFGVSTNHNLTKEFGFGRGFDYFKYLGWKNADMVNKTVSSWEGAIKQSEKYFLWLHYNDPHIPYVARSPWIERYALQSPDQALRVSRRARSLRRLNEFIPILKEDPQAFADLLALYDSEISFVDFHIGKLMERFAFESDALIIITSDHGEEFLEHDYLGHGNNLHQETIAVPLILKQPSSSKKKTVERYVNLLDIMPTILDLLDINFPDQTLGESVFERKGILQWFRNIIPKKKTSDYNFMELDKGQHSLKSIMTPEWKYIFNHQDDTEQLYKIDEDPLELNNVFYKEPELCRKFWKRLYHWVSQSKKYPPRKRRVTLSPEEEEKLRALGYIQGK